MGARHFGIGVETTYGTAVAPTDYYEILSESLKTERAFENIETVRSFSVRDVVQLSSIVRGDVEMLANYEDMGPLLKHLFGGATTTGATNPFTHTFPATTGIPAAGRAGFSLSGEVRRDGALCWTYAGLKIISLRHALRFDGASRITWGFLGKSEGLTTTPGTASYPSLLPLLPTQSQVSFDGVVLDATAFNLEVAWPVDEPYVLGSAVLGKEPAEDSVLAVSGSVEVLFLNTTQYAKFDGSTAIDIAVVSTSGTAVLTYNLNKTRLTQATPAVQARERLKATYEFVSYFDSSATENLHVVLKNSDSALP